jgi:WD40 repeat protein
MSLPESPPQAKRFPPRRLLGVGALLLAAGLLGGWWLLRPRPSPEDIPSGLDRLGPAQIPAGERFDWQPPELVAVFGSHRGRHWEEMNCAAVDPDGRWLAAGGNAKVVRLWPTARPQSGMVLRGHQDGINAVAFSPRGRLLASGSDDRTVRLWDLSGGRPRAGPVLTGHSENVMALAFAPDGKWLASVSLDGSVVYWDLRGGRPTRMVKVYAHPGGVKAVAVSPDGETVASGGGRNESKEPFRDHAIRLWFVNDHTLDPGDRLPGHTGWVTSLAFAPGSQGLLSGSQDGTVRWWRLDGDRSRARVIYRAGHTWVMAVAVAPTGRALAAAFRDGRILVWDGAGRRRLYRWKFPGPVHGLAFSSGGKHLVAANGNGTVYITRLALGSPDSAP